MENYNNSKLTLKENQQILTPFAFHIDTNLFGVKLAKPWHRALALLIDLFIVAILSNVSSVLLFFFASLVLYYVTRASTSQFNSHLFKKIIRGFAIIIFLFTSIMLIISTYEYMTITELSNTLISESTDNNDFSIVFEQTDEENNDKLSILELLQAIINDLGLSFGWAAFYFTVLTSLWHGQTLGKKLFNIRVLQLDGTPLSLWDSFGRYGGYGAGLATGLLGFLQIIWDANRQAIQDKIASTVVIKT